MKYNGFKIKCGCVCSKCGHYLSLEGYADANGNHYCAFCDDYVRPTNSPCKERTLEKVIKRQEIIIKFNAFDD